MKLLLVILAVAGLAYLARRVKPALDRQGTQLHGELTFAEHQSNTLRVATFNIQTGKDLDGRRDIRRAANALADIDMAGVQEVYAAGWLNKLGIGLSQTQALAGTGKFNHLFAATRYRWFREQRGNAVLSRLPIKQWQVQMLPDQSRKSPRNMTIVEFEWQQTDIVLINTHLHTGRGREQQLETVLAEFNKHPRAILTGDFNTTKSDAILDNALRDISIVDAIKHAGLNEEGDNRIDWILTRGLDVIEGKELAKGISDHPYFEVTLKLASLEQ